MVRALRAAGRVTAPAPGGQVRWTSRAIACAICSGYANSVLVCKNCPLAQFAFEGLY
jgi:hypothetical protein